METVNKLYAAVNEKFAAAENVLIMTHQRPDGDAMGSAFGLREFLRQANINAEVLTPTGFPVRFGKLCTGALTTLSAAEADGFDLFVAVDCANPERLGTVDTLPYEVVQKRNFVSIDHHRGNSMQAPLQVLEPEASSACQMVAQILLASGREISGETATLLMTGLMTDTGCFCFANADAAAFETAASLMRCGANVERIANEVFFSKPLNHLQFEAELISRHFRFAAGNRFAYAFVPEELMAKYHFEMREDEGLIDLLRKIDTCVIAMLSHRRSDGFRISLRSKDGRFPVGPLARKFGGGGHDMAAGCTLDTADFAEVEKIIIPEIEALLQVK